MGQPRFSPAQPNAVKISQEIASHLFQEVVSQGTGEQVLLRVRIYIRVGIMQKSIIPFLWDWTQASDRAVTTCRLLSPLWVRWGPRAAKATHLGAVSLGVFVYLSHGDVGVEFIPVFL